MHINIPQELVDTTPASCTITPTLSVTPGNKATHNTRFLPWPRQLHLSVLPDVLEHILVPNVLEHR